MSRAVLGIEFLDRPCSTLVGKQRSSGVRAMMAIMLSIRLVARPCEFLALLPLESRISALELSFSEKLAAFCGPLMLHSLFGSFAAFYST